MNDLKEQFNIELQLQEKKSNVRTLKSFLWFFIAMVVIWVLTAVDFFVIDTRWVTIAFSISTAFLIVPLVVYLKGNLEAGWVKYMLLAVLCVVVGVMNAVLSMHTVFLYVHMNNRCRVYRVGGDEFLMIIDNPAVNETGNMIACVRKSMSETRTDNGFVISSAVGYSEGKGSDIDEVVKRADESMYKDKARCKQNGDDMSRRDESM